MSGRGRVIRASIIIGLCQTNGDVEERREEREESLALMQATSWPQMHMQQWIHGLSECEKD
jgi:hypothetical protein